MKKLLFVALASFITITTRHEQPMNLKQATEIYGEDYQVIELDSVNFLIEWEDVSLVFRNNECIGGYKQKLVNSINKLYLKTCEDSRIDVNEIIFKDMNGLMPKEITMSLDELVWDIEENTDNYTISTLEIIYKYFLEIEKYYDLRKTQK